MLNCKVAFTLFLVFIYSNVNASSLPSVNASSLPSVDENRSSLMPQCHTLLPDNREYKFEISGAISKKTKPTGDLHLSSDEIKLKEEDYSKLKPFLDCALNLITNNI